MSELRCNDCGADKKCLAGCSAHPDNWYCPQCSRIKELEAKLEVKRDDCIDKLRENFTSDAIKAWKKANAELKATIERVVTGYFDEFDSEQFDDLMRELKALEKDR